MDEIQILSIKIYNFTANLNAALKNQPYFSTK